MRNSIEEKTQKSSFLERSLKKLLPWAVGASGPLLFLSTLGAFNSHEKKNSYLFEHPPEVRAYIEARKSGNNERVNFCLENFDSVRRYQENFDGGMFLLPLSIIYAMFSGSLGASIYLERKEKEK